MSPVLKCILGLFLVLCFVQFIEMAPVPADDNAANDLAAKLGEFGSSLNKIFQENANRFKDSFNAEEFKKFADAGSLQLNQFLTNLQKPGEKVTQ